MKVSIIVPIYNVEEYLSTCLKSIINQSFTNIEIILVNDGSTDNSLEICMNYKQHDNRIQIVDKENGGLSDARNAGLRAANGEYVFFIDSDDYINKDTIKVLVGLIEKYSADVAVCCYRRVKETDNREYDYKTDKVCCYDNTEILKHVYSKSGQDVSFIAWNKLYNIKLFRDNVIQYPVGYVHEDIATTYKLLYFSNITVTTNAELYYYRERESSITNQVFSKNRFHFLFGTKEAIKFFNNKQESYLRMKATEAHFNAIIMLYDQIRFQNTDMEKAKYFLLLHEIFCEDYFLYKNYLNKKRYVIYALWGRFPQIVTRLIYAYKRRRNNKCLN